jgi:SAM-dependent methyltransferase
MSAPMGVVRKIVRRLYRVPSPTYNHASQRNLRRFGSELSPIVRRKGTPILNVGGGGRAFPTNTVDCFVREVMVNIDVERHPDVHCIADAARLPFASEVFAGVLSTAVLEHVRQPDMAVKEMSRACMAGGLVYIELPFLQGFHASPNDYQRYTSSGVTELLREYDDVEVGVCVGPSSALSWVLRGYLKGVLGGFGRNRTRDRIAEFVAAWLTVPIKFLDRIVADRPAAEDLASGFFAFARVTNRLGQSSRSVPD